MINIRFYLSTSFDFLVYRFKSLAKAVTRAARSKSCLLCLENTLNSSSICTPCSQDLPINSRSCKRCAIPLPSTQEQCGECLWDPPPFDQTIAPYIYSFPIDHCVQSFKYKGKRYYGNALSKLFVHMVEIDPPPKALIPVPMTKRKQRDRGFNQSELLARYLSKHLNRPLLLNHIAKTRETSTQASLNKKSRKKNLKNAFAVTKDIPFDHIALIDDVMTTRATSEVVAQLLKDAGVERVDIWCIARTPKRR